MWVWWESVAGRGGGKGGGGAIAWVLGNKTMCVFCVCFFLVQFGSSKYTISRYCQCYWMNIGYCAFNPIPPPPPPSLSKKKKIIMLFLFRVSWNSHWVRAITPKYHLCLHCNSLSGSNFKRCRDQSVQCRINYRAIICFVTVTQHQFYSLGSCVLNKYYTLFTWPSWNMNKSPLFENTVFSRIMLNYDLVPPPPPPPPEKLKSTTEQHRFMSLVTLTGICF